MNLVVGATGMLGTEICRLLAAQRRPVRALVRANSSPGKLETLKNYGAELAAGDLKDRASLEAACRGATAVISTASSTISRQPGDSIQTVDRDGQLNLVEAAKAAGVERFIFVSFQGNPEIRHPLTDAKLAVERAIAGFDYTSLQAGCFMEVWLSPALGFDYPNAKARIYGTGQNPTSWVSYFDVAQFAVACLENPAARRATIPVGGPEALSQLEVVRVFEQESGKRFATQIVPEEALRAQFEAATDPLQKSFAGLVLMVALGYAIEMRPVLERFPIPLTSVRDYAKKVLAA